MSSRRNRRAGRSPRKGREAGSNWLSTQALQKRFGISEAPRGWTASMGQSLVVTVVVLVVAVAVNIWIGRVIHWNLVTVFAVAGFLGLGVGRRARIF